MYDVAVTVEAFSVKFARFNQRATDILGKIGGKVPEGWRWSNFYGSGNGVYVLSFGDEALFIHKPEDYISPAGGCLYVIQRAEESRALGDTGEDGAFGEGELGYVLVEKGAS